MPRRSIRRSLFYFAIILNFNVFVVVAADEAAKTDVVSISLHIVDDKGAPQSNATVSLLSYDNDTAYWQNLKRDQRSDQTGTVIYDALPADQSYRLFVRAEDGRIAFRQIIFGDGVTKSESTLKLERPIATMIQVHDATNHPIAGAVLWSLNYSGANGPVNLHSKSLQSCGITPPASNTKGELVVPALPPGTIDVRVIHPDYVPCEIKGLHVGGSADVTLKPGTTVVLHIRMEPNEKLVDSLKLDLRCESSGEDSTLIGPLPWLQSDGTAKLTVAVADYNWLRLLHPDFIAAPIYARMLGKTLADEFKPFRLNAGTNSFDFELKRKVTVRGHVLASEASHQLTESRIHGEIYSGNQPGPFGRFAEEWTHADWADINDKGEYEMKLAAGRARVSFKGDGCRATPNSFEVNVAADGSTVVPDFTVSPLPKIHGIVQDPKGQPVPNAIVRFRGSLLVSENPVTTDENGKFELSPRWIPEDFQTHQPLKTQTIVAFHPLEAIEAVSQIQWSEPESLENVVLKLEQRPPESTIRRTSDDLGAWARGVMPPGEKDHLTSISLAGKPAPELDGVEWLNTDGKRRSLADFRGKYVLLQFWTTWCNPCHEDMPSVRLVESLYRDKGLVVIGIHDNSMPIDAIKKDVIQNKLTYPIVVDQPDGRIIASYEKHGISGYPSYVLIGPDGNVLRDDATIPGPSLRTFKTEIIRQFVLSKP